MGIHRLNHAVLFVGDLDRSVTFYPQVLGFRVVAMTPDGFRAPPSCRRRTRPTTTTWACSRWPGRRADGRRPLARSGSTTWPGRSTRSTRSRRAVRLGEADALVGASDHGTTKSLYGKDPDGLEFEVVWADPAELLDDAALQARKRIRPLDLAKEKARYGADTRGGVGISYRCNRRPPAGRRQQVEVYVCRRRMRP